MMLIQVCATYGARVIVPAAVTDECLRASAAFREGGRFPVLCYLHTDTKVVHNSNNNSTLTLHMFAVIPIA